MKKLLLFTFLFLIGMAWIHFSVNYFVITNHPEFMTLVIICPIVEELYFREIPYQIGKRFKCLDLMLVASAAYFGLAHQYNFIVDGWHFSLLVQGIMGLILFYIRRKFNLFSCMIYHAMWNATALFIFPLLN